MSREIKFRAWDEGNKKMFTDVQFIKSGDDDNDWILFTSAEQMYKVEGNKIVFDNPYFRQQIHLMRYVGLNDIDGKEVFEGDICRNINYDDNTDLREIKYHQYGFWAIGIGSPTRSFPLVFISPTIKFEYEVIGNIYQNPELLK